MVTLNIKSSSGETDTIKKLLTNGLEEERRRIKFALDLSDSTIRNGFVAQSQSELQFKEYFVTIPIMKKLAYSYHYQNRDKELIFRYDNAEHHKEIATYPNHKHITNDVLPSDILSLKEVLREILVTLIQ